MVTKVADDELYIVVNAGCREKDLAHLGKHLAAFKVCGRGAVGVRRRLHASLVGSPPPPAGPLPCPACTAVARVWHRAQTCALSPAPPAKGGQADVDAVLPQHSAALPRLPCPPRTLPTHHAAPQAKGGQVDMTLHDDRSLLALQGPQAAAVLQVPAPLPAGGGAGRGSG